MKLGVTSIQRNRGKWIVEWLAFHMLVGFEHFHLYAHKCSDDMAAKLLKLARRYDIKVHTLDEVELPQLVAYQHAYNAYGDSLDWMAFIDGDEFLHPTRQANMAQALSAFDACPASAIAAYWKCYGSNGHLRDPDGLVIEDYPRHSGLDFVPNRHVKSIVRGRQSLSVSGSHVFKTENGTVDELQRPVHRGWMRDLEPSYECLRINHYVVQSHEFFKTTKQNIGAPDFNPLHVRPDSWFFEHDRNECDDGQSYRYLIPLKLKVQELQDVIASA
ncbi:MAG: glycosyltransferase family 2 protein [Burkholderiaceae bacterium]